MIPVGEGGGSSGQLLGDVGRGESPFRDSRLYFSSNHNTPSNSLFTSLKKCEPIWIMMSSI